MKTRNDGQALLQQTRELLNRQLDETSGDDAVKQLDAIKKAVEPPVEKAATFESGGSAIIGGPGSTTASAKRKSNAGRGLKLSTRTLGRLKTGIKLASLGALMSLSMLANDVQAQSTSVSPVMARVQMMTHNLDNAVAKNVRTDFVMTNQENRNEGVVEFRIKDNDKNRTLTQALLNGSEVTLPAPWGSGNGLGSSADVTKEGNFVVVRAQARGDAFSSVDSDPMLFVQGDSLSGRIDLDVKKMNVNENAFYHGLSQESLDRTVQQMQGAIDDLKSGIESGTIAPESDEAKGLQSLIQTLQENVEVQTRQLDMDWSSTLTIGDGK